MLYIKAAKKVSQLKKSSMNNKKKARDRLLLTNYKTATNSSGPERYLDGRKIPRIFVWQMALSGSHLHLPSHKPDVAVRGLKMT